MEDKCFFCGKEGGLVLHCQFCSANNIRITVDTFNKLSQQTALLDRALELAILIKNYPLNHEGELVYSIDDINKEAQALIPDLKKALEKKP